MSPGLKIKVSEDIIAREKYVVFSSNSLILSKYEAREKYKHVYGCHNDVSQTSATVTARMMTLPIEDVGKVKCQGLLHKLLANNVPLSIFDSSVLDVLVNFKWRKYGKRLMLHDVTHHLALLGAYMIYCFILCTDDAYMMATHQGNEENSSSIRISLLICWMIAFPCMYRKWCQFERYIVNDEFRGFLSWLGTAWNWMEVLSYFIILTLIPLAEYWLFREGRKSIVLSSIVALESLFLWIRVLYYVRVASKVGRFVSVISAVVLAVLPLLLIAFCVIFGFAVAFHVLYRHVGASMIGEGEESEDDDLRSLRRSFGTFGRTLFTVFGFTFGEFDLEEIYHAPAGSIATVLFVLYMVTVSTTLLNMLIAIMTREFDEIRSRERNRFIQARAMSIGDNESMMSQRRRMQVNSEIGKYLHILMPSRGREKVFRLSKRSAESKVNDDMIKSLNTLIRQKLHKQRKRHGSAPLRPQEPSVTTQSIVAMSPSRLETIQESGDSVAASIVDEGPYAAVTDPEAYMFDSESTESDFSFSYSDEDAD